MRDYLLGNGGLRDLLRLHGVLVNVRVLRCGRASARAVNDLSGAVELL